MNRLKRKQIDRPRAFWGALISTGVGIANALINSSNQKKQRQLQANLEDYNNSLQEVQGMTDAFNSAQDYQQNYLKQFKQQARLGTTRRLGSRNIMITDGGNATKIGNDTYLLRGGSHEQANETGQTGIGINVGGNEIEAEGGEVAQKKNDSLRIFSAQPILGNGMSPAQAILRGYNKDSVFRQQQAFKKRNGLKDDGSKAAFGNLITMPFAGIAKNVVDYFSGTGKYAPKRVKVSNKTVNRKPIRNGQVSNFRVVNGKYFPNEKPLRQVYPEFDIISMGRGLPIKRSLKNTVGFVQKPNTFTRGIGNREGIKDLVESKIVRGNPVGTEMTAKAYTKATKFNRNSFNDIMNGTEREGISHRYYNRSLSKEDFDAIRESYNKINASFKSRNPKASGKIRFAIGDDIYDPLRNYKNYDDYLAQIASDRKTLRNATTINPDNGEPIAYFYNDGRNPLTQGHGYASSKWGVRISNPQDYNMKIFNGHLHYSNSKTIPFDSPNVEVFRSTPFGTIRYPKWMLRRGWYRNGGLTSKDRGSSKHPYPSVSSKDFAGGGRSYPIPTKADAVDALRLAGLHGRNDVKAKVYSRYPELRKKARGGAKIEPYYDWARNTSSNLGISFIDPTYDYRAYYNSVTPYERALIRFAPQGTHFTDIGKTPKHPTFSNESKYSNDKTPGGTWNGNVFVPNIWQFGNNGTSRRNKYMNNSGEGYFNGRVNVFPTSRKRHRLGCRTKLRNGGWKAPIYNTKKYRVSNRMRQQIATWEGSDFAGQNRKFNGDAIGAKERELRQMMGRTYNYLTDNQRDSLNSIYYNSRVDTFKNRFSKWFKNLNDAVDRGDKHAFNNSLAGIRQSMTIGENRQGMSGLAKRRAWERNWFGNPIPMDSNETKAILKQQAEARMVQPTDNTRVVIQPEYIEVPAPIGHGIVPVDNLDPNLLQGNIKDNLINMGNKFRLRQKCGGKTRMRKALGCESRPVKGMRSKCAFGDVVYPYRRNNNFDYWDIIDQEQKANDKGGITPWTTSNKYDVKVPYAITKSTPTIPYTSKVSTPTSKVTENKTIPTYIGNKSGMILRDADWASLGADLIGTIGAGIIGAKSASNIYIPNIPVPYQASKLNTNYNITPQLEAIKRSRNRLANEISNNTSSSVAAINRLNLLENNANEQLNKLYNIKENRESELLNQDALNQQSVSAQNVQTMNDYNYRVAELKNARNQAKGQILSGTLQGIGNSFQNLISQGRQNYDDTQAMLMGIAASDYATPSRLLELGVDVGDDAALAGIYRSAMNIPNPGARPKREDYSDNTEYSYALTRWENQNKAYQRRNSYADLIKGRMSKKNLIKYGII